MFTKKRNVPTPRNIVNMEKKLFRCYIAEETRINWKEYFSLV